MFQASVNRAEIECEVGHALKSDIIMRLSQRGQCVAESVKK